jgi:hypothetical protein
MPTFSTGKYLKTSIEGRQDGMRTYKSMTMKSNTSLEKQTYPQTYYHNHQA